ncbi:iron uptake porin [Synechococcus sp. M16CYN]
MKLFQQILAAPATLGLLVSGVNAAEININGVSDYAADSSTNSLNQVASVTQFSDVYPTDWAYQALNNLVERYGCVAGYPNGAFRGNRVMTRYEAAALLNSCLDRTTEVTDELRRLLNEFETELAIVRGRADGLEARVGELEATQFSTTTKLQGQADLFLGAVTYDNRQECNKKNSNCNSNGSNLSYRYTLNLSTSFSGKDHLYARLRTGNMDNVWTQKDSYLADAKLGDNTLKVDKFWYIFPIGSQLTATVGSLIENYYMIETPTRYKPILKAFKLGGYGIALGSNTGQGFGLQWRQNVDPGKRALNIAANYVTSGAKSNSKKGMFGEDTDAYFLSQIGYGNRQWHISALYSLKNAGQLCIESNTEGRCITTKSKVATAMGYSTPLARNLSHPMHAVGLRGYWQPTESDVTPTISAGVDFGYAESEYDGNSETLKGWMIGLNWKDAFMNGNKLGIGFGSYSGYATSVKNKDTGNEANFAVEGYYDFQVSDNIKITPAVFWVYNAYGDVQVNGQDKFGGLIKTRFRF